MAVKINKKYKKMKDKIIFPVNGLSSEQLMTEIDHLKENDVKWESGKLYGFVYHPGNEIAELIEQGIED